MKRIVVLGQTLDIKMSHSFGNSAACPRYLLKHYVEKADERYVRVAAERGRGIHDATSSLIYTCLNSEIQPQALSLEQISEAVMTHTPQNVVSEVGLILEWAKLWAERYRISDHYYGHEEKLAIDDEFDECDWSDASYRGILDVIDIEGRHCRVTDWKSQPHIIAQGELDNPIGYGVPEQLTNYCWLASKLYPQLETFSARIFYLRYGFYDETKRTREDLAVFEQALMIKEQKISEIDNWDPIPGKHCQYCDFIKTCPLALDLSDENVNVISQEQAVQAATRVHVMDKLSKDLKEKLKVYVDQNDEVRYGDNHVFGFNKKESRKWPPDEVEAILEEYEEYSLSDVTNVDSRKMVKLLKKVAKEDPMLLDALDAVEKPKHSTRFEGYQQEVKPE